MKQDHDNLRKKLAISNSVPGSSSTNSLKHLFTFMRRLELSTETSNSTTSFSIALSVKPN